VKTLAVLIASAPVLWAFSSLVRHVYGRARQDFKEGAAYAYAEQHPVFARALATVIKLDGQLPASAPWYRPEAQDRRVYVIGGRP
jgi:hypothetical protein